MIKHPFRPAGTLSVQVLGKKEINRGDIVALTAAGYAVEATDTKAAKIIGRADTRADNLAGGDGAVRVDVLRNRAFLFENAGGTDEIKQIHLLEKCYLVDADTVGATSNGDNCLEVGSVVEISEEGVWVLIQ